MIIVNGIETKTYEEYRMELNKKQRIVLLRALVETFVAVLLVSLFYYLFGKSSGF